MSFAERPIHRKTPTRAPTHRAGQRGGGIGEEEEVHFKPASETEITYYNFSLYNNTPQPIEAKILDTRSTTIIDNPSDFELSVVRFNVPADAIPTSLVQLTGNPLVPEETVLRVGIGYNGAIIYQNIIFTPLNRPEDYIYPSGSVFTYDQLLNFVNTALVAVFLQLVALYPALVLTAPPVYVFDPVTLLISLYVGLEYTSQTPNPFPFTVHLNDALFARYLCNVRAILTVPAGIPEWQLILDDRTLITTPAAPRVGFPRVLSIYPLPLFQLRQNAPSLQRWNCLKNIVLTSSLIPITPEYITQPSQLQNSNTQTGSLPIITDFLTLGAENPLEDRVGVEYIPSAEYRMVALTGHQPIYTFDVNVFWVDVYGGLHPLILNPQTGCDIKVMFRKKAK